MADYVPPHAVGMLQAFGPLRSARSASERARFRKSMVTSCPVSGLGMIKTAPRMRERRVRATTREGSAGPRAWRGMVKLSLTLPAELAVLVRCGAIFLSSGGLPMRPSILCIYLTAVALTVTSASRAEPTAAQREACTPDVLRLCSSQIPNVAGITACLRREKPRLSPGFTHQSCLSLRQVSGRL
jgi:hypothetical protein